MPTAWRALTASIRRPTDLRGWGVSANAPASSSSPHPAAKSNSAVMPSARALARQQPANVLDPAHQRSAAARHGRLVAGDKGGNLFEREADLRALGGLGE